MTLKGFANGFEKAQQREPMVPLEKQATLVTAIKGKDSWGMFTITILGVSALVWFSPLIYAKVILILTTKIALAIYAFLAFIFLLFIGSIGQIAEGGGGYREANSLGGIILPVSVDSSSYEFSSQMDALKASKRESRERLAQQMNSSRRAGEEYLARQKANAFGATREYNRKHHIK
jgi:hypothetical protein